MKPLLVLAGGFGTRLRTLVSDVPKPLAPVNGEPFLHYLVQNWVNQGVTDFIFLLHYEAKKIHKSLLRLYEQNGYKKINFSFVVEENPLGTGGAILNAIKLYDLSNGFLVANADTWIGSGIKELSLLTKPGIAAVNIKDNDRYGALELKNNAVISFNEKPNFSKPGYVNSGLYYLLPYVFNGFNNGSCFSIEKDIFPKLTKTSDLVAIRLDTEFIDIGVPNDYKRFCEWIENGKKL